MSEEDQVVSVEREKKKERQSVWSGEHVKNVVKSSGGGADGQCTGLTRLVDLIAIGFVLCECDRGRGCFRVTGRRHHR